MAYRIERLNGELQKSISEIIRNRLKDPRLSNMISVLSVSVAKDLKTAKVTVSVFGENKEEVFDVLVKSAGFFRKELAAEYKDLRTIPQLTFILDHSEEYSERINKLLEEIKNDSETLS